VNRLVRLLLVALAIVVGLAILTEVFIRDPTVAAVLAAIVLAVFDWRRRRRRLQIRND
jgi:Na+/H+ antiporter NhaD/arsenite permease-like protein